MQNSQKLMPPLFGKCHCGKIEFELMCHLKDLKRCNCSHCRRKGFVMTTVKLDEFKLISGKKDLMVYKWNTKIAKHYFCKHCGINTHHQRRSKPNEYGVNIGCLEDFKMEWIENVKYTEGVKFSLEDKTKIDASLYEK